MDDGAAERVLDLLDRRLADLVLGRRPGEAVGERERELERARVRVADRLHAVVAGRRDRRAGGEAQRQLERLVGSVGIVAGQLDEVDAVGVAGGSADHAREALVLEDALLRGVDVGVVEAGDERARPGGDDRRGLGIVVEVVLLVLVRPGGDADAGVLAQAVVAQREVAQIRAPVVGHRDRPAGEAGRLGERDRQRLEPVERAGVAQLAVERAHQLRGGELDAGRRSGDLERGGHGPVPVGRLRGRADPVAAPPLRHVLGRVRGGEQQRGDVDPRAGGRGAAGEGDAPARLGEHALRGGGDRLDLDRGRGLVAGVAALEQDAELVAPEPRHEGAGMLGRGGDERLGDAPQRRVAGLVPAAVVDALESVDVAEQQGERRLVGGEALEGPREALLERAPVGEAGEGVLVGEPGDLGEELRAGDRVAELARDRLEEAQVGGVEAGAGRGRRRPDRPPALPLDLDRDAEVGVLAVSREQRRRRRIAVGVVERVEVGLAGPHQLLGAREVGDVVDLVLREPLLDRGELADVDQGPEPPSLVDDAADRERRRPDREPRLLGGELEHALEIVGRGDGRGDPQQGLALDLHPHRRGHVDARSAARSTPAADLELRKCRGGPVHAS